MFKGIRNIDNWLVLSLVLGGGTFIKTLGFQSYYLLFILLFYTVFSLKEDFKTSEFLKVFLLISIVSIVQLYHVITRDFYNFYSTQYFRFICHILIAYLAAKRYSTRKDIFISSFNTIVTLLIIHALLVVFISSVFDLNKNIILIQDDAAVYSGPNVLFMIRSHINNYSEIVLSDLFGFGLQRAHGIFWEPSVFACYVSIFVFINIFIRFNLGSIVLGVIAMLFAWSSTGFLLLLLISISSLIWGKANEELRNIKFGMALLLIPFSLLILLWNISTAATNSNKSGSFAQRFYDTVGSVKAVTERPIIGSGVNLEAYNNSIADSEVIQWTDQAAKSLDIKNKKQVKYSNSFLRLFLHYGIPLSLVFVYGLWNQRILETNQRLVLTLLIIVGSSFSPILELTVLSPFMYSGLLLTK